MMSYVKKSLRAKFTIALFLVGIIPLTSASVFFYYTSKDALFKNVFKELKWSVDEAASSVEALFSEAGKDLLLASQNIAFKMYFMEPANRPKWVAEQKKTLKHLRSIYPDMLDEACYIDKEGQEVARIVLDKLASDEELSSEEERTTFFKGSFGVSEGSVYAGQPTISEDTKRWVLPHGTPIAVGDKKVAILHFEINMNYFQRLLKRAVNPERGYAFIMDENGAFLANTRMDISETLPFPPAVTEKTPEALKNIYRKMTAGETNIEQFSDGGKDFYISYRPVHTSFNKGRNENRWTIGYVLPADKVYVELSILRYNIISVVLTILVVVTLAYIGGGYITRPIRELANATSRVAGGEMPKIDVKREDELGKLSESFNMMAEAVKKRDEALKALAIRDGLTGLYNHRYFKEELERLAKSSLRYNRPLSLIMSDVDYFKNYNDTHGHTQGDAALKKVAEVFLKNTREVDICARYGGEEFAVILPETDLKGALIIAERVRKTMEEEVFPFEGTQPGGDFTISLGVASVPGRALDHLTLIEAADRSLYRAKELGRNKVCWEEKEG